MKVLIIDDEHEIRRTARLSLAKVGGMEVAEASSGPQGVEQARYDRPDAILLDVMMPEIDGPATLVALRSDDATSTIPVIFLTAKTSSSEVDRLKSLGAVGVLSKPFDPLTLATQVRAVLQERR